MHIAQPRPGLEGVFDVGVEGIVGVMGRRDAALGPVGVGLFELVLGEQENRGQTDYMVASESVALNVLQYRPVRDLNPVNTASNACVRSSCSRVEAP